MKKRFTLILTVLTLVASLLCGCSSSNIINGTDGTDAPMNDMQAQEQLAQDTDNPDEVGKLIENKFIKTDEEPVSTFSADVDTASYTYLRKMISLGYSFSEIKDMAGNSLRTEEMINYFKYNYTLPAENELFGVTTTISECPWNSDAVLMCLGLTTEKIKPSAGNNFVFLIDVSGSMQSDDKLDLLKRSFGYLTQNLTGKDIVSIVTYSGNEAVVLDGCEGSKSQIIQKAIDDLSASGSTNGEAGIRKAYEIAKSHYITGGNNRIIMASDGDLNVGISSAEELKNYVAEKRSEGVYLSVLGFGTGNYRDGNMEAIADNGNGVYYYIDGDREAEKVFGTDLVSTLYTVAEDVKLQITFDENAVSEYRLVGYENRLLNKEDFEDDTKDAGEVGAGHTVTVCYELKLTENAKAVANWMKLAVRYKNPGESESLLREYSIGSSSYTEAPSDNFKFICAVAETSMLFHGSGYVGDRNLDGILTELVSLDIKDDADKTEFVSLIRTLAAAK